MSIVDRGEGLVIVGIIGSLLTLGLGLSLKSGVVTVTTGNGFRRLVENLYQTIVILMLCLVGLVVIHRYAGLGMPKLW